MADKAPFWVVPVMRSGYAARGLVYLIVGGLALSAAFYGGKAEGTAGALESLKSSDWGTPLLWIIGLGLLCYTLWRLIDAIMDLETYGTDMEGLIARGGQVVTGLIYGGIGVAVIMMAMRAGAGGGGDKADSLTAKLMSLPFGIWLVGIAGVVTLGAGGYYFYKAWTEKYKENLRRTSLTEKLDPVVKAGLVAHGVVVAMIGIFLIYAAWTAEPSQAGGLGQTFETVRQASFGRILLVMLTAGLIGFAVYCFIEAIYRIVPARAGPDVKTLARKADPRS